MSYSSIRPGKEWLDTEKNPIQAHGFSVFYDEKEACWYWYGENKEKTKKGGTIWHWGVNLYRSKDLYNWEKRGLIIPPEPDNLSSPLHPTYCMDRGRTSCTVKRQGNMWHGLKSWAVRSASSCV